MPWCGTEDRRSCYSTSQHTRTSAQTHMHMHTHRHKCTQHTHAHTYTYMHTHMNTCTPTHTHTHTLQVLREACRAGQFPREHGREAWGGGHGVLCPGAWVHFAGGVQASPGRAGAAPGGRPGPGRLWSLTGLHRVWSDLSRGLGRA